MSKARTPASAPRQPAPSSGSPEATDELAPWGNAAMIEALNGGGGAPGAPTDAPTPESVALVSLVPRRGIGADAQMGVEPGIVAGSPFEGLAVVESFGPPRPIPELFSADDLSGHPNAPQTPEAFATHLNLGEAGTFTVDCLGEFVDHHHGGGLPIQFQGWLTPEALQRGIGYEFDQTYTANGEAIGTFVVRRQIGNGWVDVDKIPTGRSHWHTSGRTPIPGVDPVW